MRTRPLRILATSLAGALALTGLPLLGAGAASSDWLVAPAQQRLPFTVLGEGLSSSVAGFPVLVQFDAGDLDYADADPAHLVFAAGGDPTPLPYEVEHWNPAGTSSVWVKAPSVSSVAAEFAMYFDGAPENATDPASVWDADYLTVQHFAAASGNMLDSTVNGVQGTPAGGVTYGAAGVSGTPAVALNGTNGNIDLGNAVGATATRMTASAFVYVDPVNLTRPYAFVAGRDETGGFKANDQFSLNVDSSNGRYTGFFTVGSAQSTATGGPLLTAGWHQLTSTFDGTSARWYLDGTQVAANSVTGAIRASVASLKLGSYTSNDNFGKYTFDEFRLSGVGRSADWVKAEYLAQIGGLVALGTVEGIDGGEPEPEPAPWLVPAAPHRLSFALQAEGLGGALPDFPVLVRFDGSELGAATTSPDRLAFTLGLDPTPLPYEVESWDASGTSSVWVRVPSLSGTAQSLTMYFGGAEPRTVESTEVWDDDFLAVHHFAASSGSFADSTANAVNATPGGGVGYGATAESGTPAAALDGVDDYIGLGAVVGKSVDAMTVSSSFYWDAANTGRQYAAVATRDQSGGQFAGEQFSQNVETNRPNAKFWIRPTGGSAATRVAAAPSDLAAGWHDWTMTYDGATIRSYLDGVLFASLAAPGALDTATLDLRLGSYSNSFGFSKLVFDEFRLSDVARTADWIAAERMSRTGALVTPTVREDNPGGVDLAVLITSPSAGGLLGPDAITLEGLVTAPAVLAYTVDGGEPVEIGSVTSTFSAVIAPLATGEHTIEVIADDEAGSPVTDSVTFDVDASGPELTFVAPIDGGVYSAAFALDVEAADPSGVGGLILSLDGAPIAQGASIDPDALGSGPHELTAVATDGFGNATTETIQFRTAGEFPDAPADPRPADDATAVDPNGVELSVAASDPKGDPLGVTFKWAHEGTALTAREGGAPSGSPERGAGALVDAGVVSAVDGQALTTASTDAYPYQQFEVAVPDALGASTFDVTWQGEVPSGHRAVVSVWNYATNSWQQVATGDGGAPRSLVGTTGTDATVRGGKARILVQDLPAAPILDDDDVTSIAWITDTQHYTNASYPGTAPTYEALIDWVLANREAQDLSYGIHTGDIVDAPLNATQWQYAARFHQKWDDADFPYGIVPGNHDKGSDGSYLEYRSLFGEWRFKDRAWYGGSKQDNVNHYDVFSTPGADYLVMYIDWDLTQDEIDWANDVIQANPESNVIIATHMYLTVSGGLEGGYSGAAPKIFNEIIQPNPNVDLVIAGHNHGVALNIKHLSDSRMIVEVLFDPQEAPNAGNGWMRTIDLDASARTMTQETFSVTVPGNNFYGNGTPLTVTDPNATLTNSKAENFTVPLAIDAPQRSLTSDFVGVTARSAAPIGGAVVAVGDDGRAAMPVTGLERDTTYRWFAEATDEDGNRTVSPVWSFTTAGEPEAPTEVTAGDVAITGTPARRRGDPRGADRLEPGLGRVPVPVVPRRGGDRRSERGHLSADRARPREVDRGPSDRLGIRSGLGVRVERNGPDRALCSAAPDAAALAAHRGRRAGRGGDRRLGGRRCDALRPVVSRRRRDSRCDRTVVHTGRAGSRQMDQRAGDRDGGGVRIVGRVDGALKGPPGSAHGHGAGAVGGVGGCPGRARR